jgi:hypothetical protein
MRTMGTEPTIGQSTHVHVWVNPYAQFTNPAQAGSPFPSPLKPETYSLLVSPVSAITYLHACGSYLTA